MATASTPYISIVIPVYCRTGWIGICIAALEKQRTDKPFEVIIVDDGSPNQNEMNELLLDVVKNSELAIQIFRKPNGGPAAARNYGVTKSSGEIVCFIDDDSIVGQNWLKEIIISFLDKSVSVVSGGIRSYNCDNLLPLLLEKSVYSGLHWATCNIAYKRRLFDKLGGFDEQFKEASWEDNDLGLRARWSGAIQKHNEQATVYHVHEELLDEYRAKCTLNGRGAAAFSRKYFFTKPLWALAVPVVMSRYLIFLLFPNVIRRSLSRTYLRYLWSLNSLHGYLRAIAGKSCK